MGLFGITANEYQQCLTYYEAMDRIVTLLQIHADSYEITRRQYLNMGAEDPIAAKRMMVPAAGRFVQAVREVIRRYDLIGPIPDAASTLHVAWRACLVSSLSWAEANLTTTIEALTNGTTPDLADVQYLETVAGVPG
jgi:hypothetical protein